jgi:hypothetical protein
MPRDGSGIYTQPFPNVVDGTTIESAVYNGFTNDVALQLNGPIPVSAGGTGGNSAASGAANLGVVTGKAVMTYTEAEKTQARQNIYAAPLDALAYNGMQVNGSMEVSQERGATATGVNASYICDLWKLLFSGTMAITGGQATSTALFPNLPNYLYVAITTAQTSLGAGHFALVLHTIEGYRIARLGWGTANAQPITIGFWSANTPAGTYSGVVRNEAVNRNYAFNYTQNVANTPEYKTVTIPGETTGGWSIGNTIGLDVIFPLACGTTYIAPAANTWSTGNYLAAPGQINGAATVNNALRITGIVVLPGSEAPSAARSPLIMRPYDQELDMCRRYYWLEAANAGGYGTIGVPGFGGLIPFPTSMRAGPTVLVAGGTPNNATSLVASNPTKTSFRVTATITVTGIWFWDSFTATADARL